MKKRSIIMSLFLIFSLVCTNIFFFPSAVSAKEVTSIYQAKRLAKAKVKGATVTEVDQDYENGTLVYEVQLIKGKKEYDLVYRASDAKLISYGWEINSIYIRNSSKSIISTNKCKKLAKKQVPGGTLTSIVKKYSDGIDIYKVVMKKGNKEYELKFHARTGKLLEYDWELTTKKNQSTAYIGAEKAKQIALNETGGGHVTKVVFDMDDGVPVYEVEIIKDVYEYDIEIHAKTGKILDFEMDSIYD